jgi:DNA-binding beta-propeller fold protein YncE
MARRRFCGGFAALALAAMLAAPASADLVVVAVDNHSVNVNGVVAPPKNAPSDLLAIVDAKSYPPKLVGTVEAATSVVGAPTAVWIAPDESWAIITAATQIDPADPTKIIEDDRVSVIDLKSLKVTQTVHAGKGANEISVSPDGTLALVANRAEGTLSVFTVSGKQLTASGAKVDLGNPKSTPSSVKFLPDGKTALITLYGDDAIGVLRISGSSVTLDKQRIVTGVNPYTLDISGDGKIAVVGNMGGGGNGEICTVSLIDLAPGMFHTIDTVAVPSSPEGIKLSPDGKFIAVASVDGTTKPSDSPLFHDHGRLWMLAIAGGRMKPVAEAKTGRWSQGVAFSKDGKTVMVESMIDHGLDVFRWNGTTLIPGPTVDVKGGAAAIRTSWP